MWLVSLIDLTFIFRGKMVLTGAKLYATLHFLTVVRQRYMTAAVFAQKKLSLSLFTQQKHTM